jgi:transcriptional repressor NF-X1
MPVPVASDVVTVTSVTDWSASYWSARVIPHSSPVLLLCFRMSSTPSAQTQHQSIGVNQNLERTDTLDPHRNHNRDHRPINHNDSSSRDETGFDRENRQITGRRRRPKPKGSIADEPHASSVTSQTGAPSIHPQSEQTASAYPASASGRTSSNNRNRVSHPARGRAIPHALDENSGPSRHSRRAGRSTPRTNVTADTQAPVSHANPRRKRDKAPAGDDLTSILTFSLSNPPFPECMICFNPIRPEQPTWSCSPREEKEAQSCWNTFHLKCIHPWAEKSVKDLEEAWRARGEEKIGEWRCPGCQSRREIVPRKYR